MALIQNVVLKRFGIGAFASTSKSKVVLRKIAGQSENAKSGNFQSGFTIPRDLFDIDDIGYLYEVHRDNEGNYIFKKTSKTQKAIRERYT
jgi:hypothetical protein